MSPTLEAKGENPCSESCDRVLSSNRGPGAGRGAGREAAVSSGHTRAQTGKDNSQQETGHLRTHQGMAYPTQLDWRKNAWRCQPGAPRGSPPMQYSHTPISAGSEASTKRCCGS